MGTSGVKTEKEKILQAIKDSKGVVRQAARLLGVYTDVIYDARKRDEEIAQALDEAKKQNVRDREDWIDLIKHDMYEMLHYRMTTGDTTAIIYAMKTFGGHSDGSGITINVVKKDPTID